MERRLKEPAAAGRSEEPYPESRAERNHERREQQREADDGTESGRRGEALP